MPAMRPINEHGYIYTLGGGLTVCPSDYIIQGIWNEFYPCKEGLFKESYDEVEEVNEKISTIF